MKNVILVVFLTGCASTPPVWQQELNNLNRQWSEPVPIVYPVEIEKEVDVMKVCRF